MRTEFGYKFFRFVSNQVTVFLEYTNRGSMLVFGPKFIDHPFAFQVLNLIKNILLYFY